MKMLIVAALILAASASAVDAQTFCLSKCRAQRAAIEKAKTAATPAPKKISVGEYFTKNPAVVRKGTKVHQLINTVECTVGYNRGVAFDFCQHRTNGVVTHHTVDGERLF